MERVVGYGEDSSTPPHDAIFLLSCRKIAESQEAESAGIVNGRGTAVMLGFSRPVGMPQTLLK